MNRNKFFRDPYKVTLWYILLGKRNVLATLFKQNSMTDKKMEAMGQFLGRNFSDEK